MVTGDGGTVKLLMTNENLSNLERVDFVPVSRNSVLPK